MIGRIVRSIDFERVLAAPTRARSPHFAVHYLQGAPSLPHRPAINALSTSLSTDRASRPCPPVDETRSAAIGDGLWLGAVVPKRHARRAVTRSMLKRQIRAAVARQPQLPGGLWVVRLRAPFDLKRFPSAASDALSETARVELDALLADALRRGR